MAPASLDTATLMCSCADRTGIVATLTQFVARNLGNIVSLDQHSDRETNRFFMRLEWDMHGMALERGEVEQALTLETKRFEDMRFSLYFARPRPRVALFASIEPHCLADLLLQREMGEFEGDVAVVVSNHETLRPLVDHYGIPFEHVPVAPAPDAAAKAGIMARVEERQEGILARHGVDLVVLARYMQIVPPGMCDRWTGRMINIHHSFLPAFVGAKPYHQAKARGVKIIGATAHYVTSDLDQGPIIEQGVVPVSHRDEIEDLIRKGRDVERQVLGRAVRRHLERRVYIEGNRTIVFNR